MNEFSSDHVWEQNGYTSLPYCSAFFVILQFYKVSKTCHVSLSKSLATFEAIQHDDVKKDKIFHLVSAEPSY